MKLTEILKHTPDVQLANRKAKIERVCNNYKIQNFTIRDDLKVDVLGDVHLADKKFKKLPIQFGKVTGFFTIRQCFQLETLEGAPEECKSFNANTCIKLTSLKGGPTKIETNYTVFGSSITEFGYQLPDVVIFSCGRCSKLTSLKGSPKRIKEDFDCNNCNSLKSLESSTEYIGRDFNARDCKAIETLEGLPEEIRGVVKLQGLTKVKNYLALFNISKVSAFTTDNKQLDKIINSNYQNGQDYAACQEDLIAAGLEKYAEF